jgi:diguanylate cyclase (GGDEF)-like protein
VLGAVQWQNYIGVQQQHEVATTTATARASISGALQRDEDLVQTLRGVVASGTTISNSQLQQLYENVGATNSAGLIGVAYIEAVPYSGLAAYESAVQADPPFGVAPATPDVQAVEGVEPQYCLIRLGAASATGVKDLSSAGVEELDQDISTNFDYCDSRFAIALGAAATSSEPDVAILSSIARKTTNKHVSPDVFDLVLPIYRAGAPTTNLGQREMGLLGWAIGLFSPGPVLGPLVKAGSNLAVTLEYHNPAYAGVLQVATGGHVAPGSSRTRVSLSGDGDWSAEISVLPSSGSATVQGIGVLADLLVIVLLMALIVSLFRSRRRALDSIALKNRQLEHRALHDSLTGLPNRDRILEMAAAMLERAEERGATVAAYLVDLDGFNAINDIYGHRIGDQVLGAVAERLTVSIGEADRLGRLSGDEFVVLAEGPSIANGPDHLADVLISALSAPFEIVAPGGEALVRLTACVGAAVGPGRSAEDLLRDADTALNEAKSAGKRRYTVFEPEMHTAARARLAMTSELRTAIEQRQFFLVYQPIFQLADVHPTGVEALLRWRHPLRGVVPPLEFIPLLEETGMITDVGLEVLRLACDQAKVWEQRGLPIYVSVNASAIQLESESFAGDVDRVIQEAGLDPSRLTIEITESALMRDAHTAVKRLANLKALGIRLAIDDFGTGYSSLAYLRQFPVDVLKIDRSFVNSMTSSSGGMALVRTMLELARALDLETVAEGIEEEGQLSALETEHCRSGQGFLLARPLEAHQIELFFDNARPRRIGALSV